MVPAGSGSGKGSLAGLQMAACSQVLTWLLPHALSEKLPETLSTKQPWGRGPSAFISEERQAQFQSQEALGTERRMDFFLFLLF